MTSKERKHGQTMIDKNTFNAVKNDTNFINYIGSKLLMNTPEFTAQKRKFSFSKCEHCGFALIY